MKIGIMAILAKVGDLFFHQVFMAAAVSVMTDGAVFFNRRVFPDKGASFFGMALVAELIDVVFKQHTVRKAAMGVMTVAALYFPLDNRMVGNFTRSHAD